jgi:hypothetical protein
MSPSGHTLSIPPKDITEKPACPSELIYPYMKSQTAPINTKKGLHLQAFFYFRCFISA